MTIIYSAHWSFTLAVPLPLELNKYTVSIDFLKPSIANYSDHVDPQTYIWISVIFAILKLYLHAEGGAWEHECSDYRGQKSASESLELELQAAGSGQLRVLGSELRFSGRAANSLSC